MRSSSEWPSFSASSVKLGRSPGRSAHASSISLWENLGRSIRYPSRSLLHGGGISRAGKGKMRRCQNPGQDAARFLMQVQKSFSTYGRYLKNIRIIAITANGCFSFILFIRNKLSLLCSAILFQRVDIRAFKSLLCLLT